MVDEQYLRRSDMAAFAGDTSQKVVSALWEILTTELPRYARSKGWPRIQMRSAETAESLDVAYIPPSVQAEGVAIARSSLENLPVEEPERWEFSFFQHDEELWDLFRRWVRYLKQRDSN